MGNFIAGLIIALVGIAAAVALGALLALPVMWIWNDTATVLFGFKSVSFAQAWGLLILCSILFKSTSTGAK